MSTNEVVEYLREVLKNPEDYEPLAAFFYEILEDHVVQSNTARTWIQENGASLLLALERLKTKAISRPRTLKCILENAFFGPKSYLDPFQLMQDLVPTHSRMAPGAMLLARHLLKNFPCKSELYERCPEILNQCYYNAFFHFATIMPEIKIAQIVYGQAQASEAFIRYCQLLHERTQYPRDVQQIVVYIYERLDTEAQNRLRSVYNVCQDVVPRIDTLFNDPGLEEIMRSPQLPDPRAQRELDAWLRASNDTDVPTLAAFGMNLDRIHTVDTHERLECTMTTATKCKVVAVDSEWTPAMIPGAKLRLDLLQLGTLESDGVHVYLIDIASLQDRPSKELIIHFLEAEDIVKIGVSFDRNDFGRLVAYLDGKLSLEGVRGIKQIGEPIGSKATLRNYVESKRLVRSCIPDCGGGNSCAGLASQVQAVLGRQLRKDKCFRCWHHRPLPWDQALYAAVDVGSIIWMTFIMTSSIRQEQWFPGFKQRTLLAADSLVKLSGMLTLTNLLADLKRESDECILTPEKVLGVSSQHVMMANPTANSTRASVEKSQITDGVPEESKKSGTEFAESAVLIQEKLFATSNYKVAAHLRWLRCDCIYLAARSLQDVKHRTLVLPEGAASLPSQEVIWINFSQPDTWKAFHGDTDEEVPRCLICNVLMKKSESEKCSICGANVWEVLKRYAAISYTISRTCTCTS